MHPAFNRFLSCLAAALFFLSLLSSSARAQTLAEEAAQGGASAQYLMGLLYLDGTRVPLNYKTAESWLLKAANQGHRRAQYQLAALYTDGKQLKQDYKKAFYWGNILAKNGFRMAQYGVGYLYENGLGTAKDPAMARRWLESASALGSPSAIAYVETLDKAAQIKAFADAAYYPALLKKAHAQDAVAQYRIGHAYLTGEGLEKNQEKAFSWLQLAAQQGDMFALYDLSYLYPMGQGMQPEYAPAVSLLQAAAARGHVKALFNLGGLYERGDGVNQDWNEAYRLYILAAGRGDANAIQRLQNMEQICSRARIPVCETFSSDAVLAGADNISLYRVGLTLMDGDGITQSYGQALKWFRLSADKGNVEALYQMGESYENGLGIERNIQQALYWYSLAAQQGHVEAQQRLKAR